MALTLNHSLTHQFVDKQLTTGEEDNAVESPLRYDEAVSLYGSSSNGVMSKKVKARPTYQIISDSSHRLIDFLKPSISHVYKRRRSRRCGDSEKYANVKMDGVEDDFDLERRKRIRGGTVAKLGQNWRVDGKRTRDQLSQTVKMYSKKRKIVDSSLQSSGGKAGSATAKKKWVRLSFDNVDPKTFVGLQCKIFWPLDADWYAGRVVEYCSESNKHTIKYDDGESENLILANEKAKFFVSREEIDHHNFSICTEKMDGEVFGYDEMVVMAAGFDDCQVLEPGNIIWAKVIGYAMWPAIIVDESLILNRKGLKQIPGGKSVLVHFFGTHDFARFDDLNKCKWLMLLGSHAFLLTYLREQKLPERMLELQKGTNSSDACDGSIRVDKPTPHLREDSSNAEGVQKMPRVSETCPYVVTADLQIINLGNIEKDSEYFQDDKCIWPEGYSAVRKFISIKDPSLCTSYKMEVLRDTVSKIHPLFRVTVNNGLQFAQAFLPEILIDDLLLLSFQFKGSTPSACWNKIYKRIRKKQKSVSDGCSGPDALKGICKSGNHMFGFSHPKVRKLIKGLSKSKICKLTSGRHKDLLIGFSPVHLDCKDFDKCSVCHMDEEYLNNLFLQCDKCRMMVHARCYGELEPMDGVLWLCNLCRPGAPDPFPPCCLCPVIGGAMKPTNDGRWAHLACAIWIPETCFLDVKRMEPIDGINRINKDRWKLICSLCKISYGACIQCSNDNCLVAYHPLCARAAGLCAELEDEGKTNLLSVDDDKDLCVRFRSFCKKHKQPSNDRLAPDEKILQNTHICSDYIPPLNPSGCARTEPYNYFGRRGRKEPEALAAASLKRLFVENQPYLVGRGFRQQEFLGSISPSSRVVSLLNLRASLIDPPNNIVTMAEKYRHMKETFRKRLAFGKSGIHGFGIFAKHPHRAGDMVIEYTGELVRPSIADRRERFIYNSLVGAGTYMFRIDDERVIDATRAGSIAHLINHSCEPNCYSRGINVNGDEHIIIFAKRDIKRWEELTYDYRFFSVDEQLTCYCGSAGCRGVVNDKEAEQQAAEVNAPRSALTAWTGA
ncbi:hypothetical protein ACFE04_015787 [Oxalis oulophora]